MITLERTTLAFVPVQEVKLQKFYDIHTIELMGPCIYLYWLKDETDEHVDEETTLSITMTVSEQSPVLEYKAQAIPNGPEANWHRSTVVRGVSSWIMYSFYVSVKE